MKELFNDYVQSLETYIMFQIGEETARLKPELEAKGRAPISLSMGAPVAPPPQFVIDKLIDVGPFELVEKTHREDPWKNFEPRILKGEKSLYYSDEEIKHYFSTHDVI